MNKTEDVTFDYVPVGDDTFEIHGKSWGVDFVIKSDDSADSVKFWLTCLQAYTAMGFQNAVEVTVKGGFDGPTTITWDSDNSLKITREVQAWEDEEETADDVEPTPTDGWTENTGIQPVADNVLVDVQFEDGRITVAWEACEWIWERTGESSDIVRWRYATES